MELYTDNHQLNDALDAYDRSIMRWLETDDMSFHLQAQELKARIANGFYPYSLLGSGAAIVARYLYLTTGNVPSATAVKKVQDGWFAKERRAYAQYRKASAKVKDKDQDWLTTHPTGLAYAQYQQEMDKLQKREATLRDEWTRQRRGAINACEQFYQQARQ